MAFIMAIPDGIRRMMAELHENGFDAYLVGGCVRDSLMGIPPHDYDITTDAVPEEIVRLFGESSCTRYGKAFGTVCVRKFDAEAEITTFRTEGAYSDGRHPDEVTFAKDVHDDLSRRDFTCNAIAYDPRTGLLDPYHGADDLESGILRAVGVADQRFSEDALRILRGMRFYARFRLVPETSTDQAMRDHAPELAHISVERVFTELCGMLMGDHITQVLLDYPDILSVWIPEITPCVGFEQHSRWHDFTVWEHIARTVGNAPKDLTVRTAMLLHDIEKPSCFTLDARGGHFKGHAPKSAVTADKILLRLKSDNRMRSQVTTLIDLHRFTPKRLADVRRLYGKLGAELFSRYIAVLDADRVSKWQGRAESRVYLDRAEDFVRQIEEQHLACTVRELAVRGNEAAALGLQGKAIREALEQALEAVITEQIPNEKDALLAFLREQAERS